jgi:hypothetical protein
MTGLMTGTAPFFGEPALMANPRGPKTWNCPLLVAAEAKSTAPRWEGVDKTVVEKVATEAGHPPRPPYIDTEQGDLLLFLFLLAGAVGGFAAGYTVRTLFPPKDKGKHHSGMESTELPAAAGTGDEPQMDADKRG